jgi:rfaE bifunctional protein kinase chain/domain
MSAEFDVTGILNKIAQLRVTVFGDFCLDAYWIFDEGEQELSVETGLPLRRVREQTYSLGGAGNVVANLVDLGAGQVSAVGLAGDDLFGDKLAQLLRERNVGTAGFLQVPDWQTMVYVKPMQGGAEGNRIDFGAFNRTSAATRSALLERLAAAAAVSDVIVLNQQVPGGVSDPEFIAQINDVLSSFPEVLLVVDARHFANVYRSAVMKLNGEEAARFLAEPCSSTIGFARTKEYAERISKRTGKPVFVTRGEHGMVVAEGDSVFAVPGLRVDGPVDPVGAGDTVVSALAAALGSGSDSLSAAQLANIAAMITVQKLGTTGTATPAEIRESALHLNYVPEPQYS